jgi:hypothetical protein
VSSRCLAWVGLLVWDCRGWTGLGGGSRARMWNDRNRVRSEVYTSLPLILWPNTPQRLRLCRELEVHAAGCRRMKLARYRQDRGRVRSAVLGKYRRGLMYCKAWRQVSGWLRGRWSLGSNSLVVVERASHSRPSATRTRCGREYADPNAQSTGGMDSLYLALEGGHPGLVQLLLKHGADPNARGVDGQTLLHVSSRRGHLKAARGLLKLDVDINSRGNEARTPLQDQSSGSVGEWQKRSCATIVGARCRKYVTPARCGRRNAGTTPSFE